MKMIQRRIAVFLCMLMAFTAIAAYLPSGQDSVEAASDVYYSFFSYYGGFSDSTTKLSDFTDFLVVEKGNSTLYLRDIMHGFAYKDGDTKEYTGKDLTDAKYVSKNTDILTVDSKTGKINAKKTGTALVKITWKKNTVYGAIKVISKSDMKAYRTKNASAISYAKKVIKAYGDELNTANALKVRKLKVQMQSEGIYGFTDYEWENKYDEDGNWESSTSETIVYSMDAWKAELEANKAEVYLANRNPFTTTGSYSFKISSLSGSGKTVTAVLSKAVTADQMAGAQYSVIWDDASALGAKSLTIDVYLRDTKTDSYIAGKATIKTGSKNIKITTDSSLTKGRKYELMMENYAEWGIEDISSSAWVRDDWLHNGKSTFTAK